MRESPTLIEREGLGRCCAGGCSLRGVCGLGDDEQARERRAHALLVDVLGGGAEDLAVRVDDRGEHVVERTDRGAETGLELLDGERAGDLAGLVAAHAVGHGEEVGLDEDAVLVLLTDPTRIGPHAPFEDGHQCLPWPMVTAPPSRCSRPGRGRRDGAGGSRAGGCRCGTTRSWSRGPRPSPARRPRRRGRDADDTNVSPSICTVHPASRPIVISVLSANVAPRRAFGSRTTSRPTRPRRPFDALRGFGTGAARVSDRSLTVWLATTRRSVRTSCHTAQRTRAKKRYSSASRMSLRMSSARSVRMGDGGLGLSGFPVLTRPREAYDASNRT